MALIGAGGIDRRHEIVVGQGEDLGDRRLLRVPIEAAPPWSDELHKADGA
jgi:hypothetical protein